MDTRIPTLERGLDAAVAGEFGLSGPQAAWIGAVCQLSGVYCDAQLAWSLDLSPRSAVALSRRWIEGGWIREHRFGGLPPVRHILSRSLYGALGIADVRYRKLAGDAGGLARGRLLGLDAALQLTDEFGFLPWCATEGDKLAVADGYRVPRADIPSRTYVTVAGGEVTVRWFVPKRPVAIPTPAARRDLRGGPPAVFVWTDGAATVADPLRSWAGGLFGLWRRLGAAGVPLRLVAVTAERERLEAIGGVLQSLRVPSVVPGGDDPDALQLRRDIGQGRYGDHGSLNDALRAYARLQGRAELANGPEGWSTQSLLAQRLAGGAVDAAGPAAAGGTVRERHHDMMEALLAEVRAGEVQLTVADLARELSVSERTVRRNWGAELAAARRGREA